MKYIDLDSLGHFLENIKNKLVTINNQSLWGGGNINVGVKPLQSFSSTTLSMTPNIYYKASSSLSSLTVSLNTPTDTSIVNEYLLEFTVNSGATLNFPSSIKWANGEVPTFETGKTYQISIVNNLAVCAVFS